MHGLDSQDNENNAPDEQGERDNFIHNFGLRIVNGWLRTLVRLHGCMIHSGSSAPGKEVEQHHDQRHHQQEVYYATHRVTGQKPEQPQDDQDYR
jgi:hypothetical protein